MHLAFETAARPPLRVGCHINPPIEMLEYFEGADKAEMT